MNLKGAAASVGAAAIVCICAAQQNTKPLRVEAPMPPGFTPGMTIVKAAEVILAMPGTTRDPRLSEHYSYFGNVPSHGFRSDVTAIAASNGVIKILEFQFNRKNYGDAPSYSELRRALSDKMGSGPTDDWNSSNSCQWLITSPHRMSVTLSVAQEGPVISYGDQEVVH